MNTSDKIFNITLRSFESQVLYFNGMYKLPVAPVPSLMTVVRSEKAKADHNGADVALCHRLLAFKKTLADELNEIDSIIKTVREGGTEEVAILTDIADLLGDIQVYCASEMIKFGIPIQETLSLIMQSNFSKLQADGSAKYDEHGKVQKGPNYWKPEPSIKAMLEKKITGE